MSNERKLTESERSTISHGLQVAANHFETNAATARKIGHVGLAIQFEKQAAESRQIAQLFEVADQVALAVAESSPGVKKTE